MLVSMLVICIRSKSGKWQQFWTHLGFAFSVESSHGVTAQLAEYVFKARHFEHISIALAW